MKICCISDTHNTHRDLKIPKCDVLVHAGDITRHGEPSVLIDFCDWLLELKADGLVGEGICIPGNHDLTLDPAKGGVGCDAYQVCMEDSEWHYIPNESCTIDGVKFWGVPQTPEFFDWAFNVPRGDLWPYYAEIDDDVDVLVGHGPPKGAGDLAPDVDPPFSKIPVGCEEQADFLIKSPNIKLVICGHIHCDRGAFLRDGKTIINAAICGREYRAVNRPILIDI